MAVEGFDDPSRTPLLDFYSHLIDKNGTLIIFGDSVMKQFASAMTCELERGVQDESHLPLTDSLTLTLSLTHTHSLTPTHSLTHSSTQHLRNATLLAAR